MPLDPITGAAIINGGASLLNGIGSLFSGSSANRRNVAMQRETNALNYKMFQEQNQYNTNMWHMTNKYNSPAAQVQRLMAAGLNPYLMLNGGSAGTAQSMLSASPAAVQSPSVNPLPFNFDGSSVANTMIQGQLADANVRKIIAEAAGQEKQNQWYDVKLQAEIENLKQNTHSGKAREELDKFGLIHARSMWSGELAAQSLQNSSLAESVINQRANTLYTQMQSTLAEMNIAWLPKMKQAELAQLSAQTFAAIEAGKLSQKQGVAAIQNALESQARTQGIKINNNTLKAQSKYIISKASWDANKSKWDSIHSKHNSGPDSYFQMMNGKNGYSGPGVGLFNVMDYMLKAIPFSNLK